VRRARVSIKDIARVAGVSHSTVSRALRDSPLISIATRRRIQQLADEMGYIPNAVAQSLQMRRSGTIGLAVTTLSDPFFADVVEGVEEIASSSGLGVFVTSSHNDPEAELRAIETFHRRRVDGIIVAASRLSHRHARQLERIDVPIVLVNQHEGGDSLFNTVAVDEYGGARMAVEYLLSCSHRRIAYLGLGNRLRSNQQRLLGYRDALADAGIVLRSDWIQIVPADMAETHGDVNAGQYAARRLIGSDITALFCYNDRTAVGVLLTCRDEGLNVPGDWSVVGFDDIELARYMSPPLTTVAQPKREMGRQAMRMVLELLEGRPVTHHTVTPCLVVRDSVAPLSRGASTSE
jgi:DNA-binding LacI/PurR family transcriptional regulator